MHRHVLRRTPGRHRSPRLAARVLRRRDDGHGAHDIARTPRERGPARAPRAGDLRRGGRSRHTAAVRSPFPEAAGTHRLAQLRPHRSDAGRPLSRARRLRGAATRAGDATRGRDRRSPALGAARPRRRRLSDGAEVEILPRLARIGKVPDLQRGRGRPRRLHGSRGAGGRSARGARRHVHRRLRHRRESRLHLYPRRVSPCDRAPARGDGADARAVAAGRQHSRYGVRVRPGHQGGCGRVRLRRGDRAHRQHRGAPRDADGPPAVPRGQRAVRPAHQYQ